MKYQEYQELIIGEFKVRVESDYLCFSYHYSYEIEKFFKSLGITKEEFIKKFDLGGGGIFPLFPLDQRDEIIDYLLHLASIPNQEININYEIY
jgi:hypothetical protein